MVGKYLPAILIPGLGGSRLWRKNDNEEGGWQRVWFSEIRKFLLHPAEVTLDSLSMMPEISDNDGLLWQDSPTFVEDFGGLEGIKCLAKIPEEKTPQGILLPQTGYEGLELQWQSKTSVAVPGTTVMEAWINQPYLKNSENRTYRFLDYKGHPMDWRLPPWQINWKATKILIENAKEPVILIAYSLGSVYLNYFLNHEVDQEWKDNHIKLFVSLGAPFKGSSLSAELVLNPQPLDSKGSPQGAYSAAQETLNEGLNKLNNIVQKGLNAFDQILSRTYTDPSISLTTILNGKNDFGRLNSSTIRQNSNIYTSKDSVITTTSFVEESDDEYGISAVADILHGYVESLRSCTKSIGSSYVLLPDVYINKKMTSDFEKQRIIDETFKKLVIEEEDNEDNKRTILSKDPGVKTLCVWGELEGATTWVTDSDTLKRSKGKGDGTVEVTSSSSCMDWNNVTGLRLNGVNHYGMVQRQDVIAEVLLQISKETAKVDNYPDLIPHRVHARDLQASLVDDTVIAHAHHNIKDNDGFKHTLMKDMHGLNEAGPLFILWSVICGIGFVTFMMSTLKFVKRFSSHMYELCSRTMRGISRGIVTALGGQMPPSSRDRQVSSIVGGVRSVIAGGTAADSLTTPLLLDNTRDRIMINHQWPIVGSSPIVDGATLEHRNDRAEILRENEKQKGPQNREYIHDINALPGEYGYANFHTSLDNSFSYSTGGLSMQRPSRLAQAKHWQLGYRQSPGVRGGEMPAHRWLPTKGEEEYYGLIGGMYPYEEQFNGYDMYGNEIVDSAGGAGFRRGFRDGRVISHNRLHYGGGSPVLNKSPPRDNSYRGAGGVNVNEESVEAVQRSAYLERLRLKQAESRFNHLLTNSSHQQPHGSAVTDPISVTSTKDGKHLLEGLTITEEDSTPTVPTGTGVKHHRSIRLPPLIRGTPNTRSNTKRVHDIGDGHKPNITSIIESGEGTGAILGSNGNINGVVALSDFALGKTHYGADGQ